MSGNVCVPSCSAQRLAISAEVQLPAGWSATVPEDAAERAPQGSYSVKYARDGGAVTARLELDLNGSLVAPQEYAAFRAFLGRLDRALGRKVEAAPPAQTASNEDR